MGMVTVRSQCSRTFRRMPFPSLPRTRATLPRKSMASAGEAIDLLQRHHTYGHARLFRGIKHPVRIRSLCNPDVVNPLRMRSDCFENGIDAVDDHPLILTYGARLTM